jgi:hypothetical protein
MYILCPREKPKVKVTAAAVNASHNIYGDSIWF